jgi:TANFOR domain-containing protein
MKGNHLYQKIFLITTVCVIFFSLHVSAQVDIKINILPPYPSKITDYASRPQQVLILVQNVSNLAQDIQLRGTITGDNGIVLRVNPQYKSPSPIHLGAGQTLNLNGADINQLFDYNQLIFSGITRDQVIRGNGLPEGNYQVCVQAFNYNSNQPLSATEPMGCSNVFPITSVEPPYIISPFNEQSISAQTTQNFVITWSTPAGAPPSTQYTVEMVEILDNRNANDAINTATTPPFFQQTINSSNLLLYGPSMPSLTPGRRYALIVIAKDPFNSVTFRNGGRSEVTSFIYGQPADTTGTNGTTTTNNSNNNIPSVTIKGNINWYYRKSEEVAPLTKTTYTPLSINNRFYEKKVSGNSNLIVGAALSDPSFVAAVKPASVVLSGESNNNNSMFKMASLKSVKPTAPIVPSTSSQLTKISLAAISVMGGGYYMAYNTSNPAFFNNYGSQSHPLSNTIIKLMAADTTQPSSSPILVGAAVTDADGNFQLAFVPPATFNNSKGYKYSVSMQNNYFSMPGYSFSIPANTTNYDLGELKALANTYRYIPFALNGNDTEIVNATVKIYRRADFYNTNPSLKTEGDFNVNNRAAETIDGQQYILIDTVSDGYTATRLFYSSGSDDEYKVVVNAPRYSTYNTSLSTTTTNTNLTSPQTIQQVYQLAIMPNTLSGNVSKVLEQSGLKQSMPGAVVTLYLTDESYNKVTHVSNHLILANAGVNADVLKPVSLSSGSSNNKPSNEKVMTVNKNISNPIVKTNQPSTTTGNGNNQFVKSITPSALVNNMNVILINGQMTATTDSSGNFSISNIPVSTNGTKFLKIVVKLPGSDVTLTDSLTAYFPTEGIQIDNANEVFKFKSYAVTGKVVDDKKNPISAGYKWVSGGSEAQTDANGYIATFHESGNDTLLIYKLGYDTVRYPVPISGNLLDTTTQVISSGNNRLELKIVALPGKQIQSDATTNYLASLKQTPTYKQSVAQGNPISPSGFGFTSNTKIASTAFANSMLNKNDNPSHAVDLGTVVLKKETGRMLITVTDNNNNPINNASIQIDGIDSIEQTDKNGKCFIEGPAGSLLLNVSSDGSSLAPQQVAITVSIIDTTKITVQLKQGIKVTGTVKANNAAISGADIIVDGLDYIHATSKTDGSYSIIIPQGDYTLKAAKSGFVSDSKEQTFTASATINFTLTTASFNITKLVGFNVQIDNIVNEDATHKKLSGSFINLPNNSVFALKSGTTIPFSNVEVVIQNNIPVPANGVINTDVTELALKAYNFLPLKLTNNSAAIVVRSTSTAGDAGQIEGLPAIDYASFVPSGIAPYVDASLKQYVQNQSASSAVAIPVINSGGQLSAASLSISGSGSQSFNLYGFNVTLDLANSSIKSDGLHLKGSIDFKNIPLISNTTLQIQDLSIGTNGYVSNVSVNMNPAPKFQIASWSASLTGLSFNDNGFSISGNVQVQIPSSQTSEIDFANLTISTDQLYGGSFTIPSAGIDVFGIVKFLGGSMPLSFGKIGSSSVYYIGGSGTVQFPSLFGNMSLQFFQIQTDGKFAATVQTNINEDFFGLANVQITDVGFHTINGIGIDVNGNFALTAIPFLKASAGGVHFGTGGSVSVDDIGLSFDMAGIAAVSAHITFVNQPDKKGFAGDGSITIIGLPGANIGFSYYKLPNGISVSANFKANISIPIGAIVSLNNPGGGFSLNTADHSWSVNINGNLAVTGLGPAVTISVSVTVTNGPVITGTAALNVATINVANASVVLDVPKSLFTININANITLIPKVVSANGSAIFTLSAAKNDSYFMIAAQYESSILHIFDERVNIAAGWGLNVNNHPEYSEFTSFIDPNFLDNGVLKGISMQATSDIDFEATGSIYIASGSIWYKNKVLLSINAGIGADNYSFDIGSAWDCGASISLPVVGTVAGVDVGAGGNVHVSYSSGCFSANASLNASLSVTAGAGCSDDCFTGVCTEYIVPSGAKICAHPNLNVGYDCNNGFSFGIGF